MYGKSLLSIKDLNRDEILRVLDLAGNLKARAKAGERWKTLEGKTLALLFEKPSLRTRVSFEVAIDHLGGRSLYIHADSTHRPRGETLSDTARVLSRYVDGIVFRAYKHRDIQEVAANASVPIINGLSDLTHPCQALTDIFTIREKKGAIEGLKLAYIGDGNNVCNSLLYICAMLGIHISVATPFGFEPAAEVLKEAGAFAADSGCRIETTHDPRASVPGADVVYTDVWVSMGQEEEQKTREKAFSGYKVDRGLLSLAKPEVIFMHDLPAHRGAEVEDEVIDGESSVVFDQAENRLHVQRAILHLQYSRNGGAA